MLHVVTVCIGEINMLLNFFSMNEDQLHAADLAVQGHSLLITGSCGTGKTQTVSSIVGQLLKKGKKVVVCASTGKVLMKSLITEII